MIPTIKQLLRPILEEVARGETPMKEVISRVSEQLRLTPEAREARIENGKRTRIAVRTQHALKKLVDQKLIARVNFGRYAITEQGKEYLNRESFSLLSELVESQKEEAPYESLLSSHAEIEKNLAEDLLARVKAASPDFLENLIVELMRKMNYGNSQEPGRVLGRSGDDGVDGVIYQDALGLERIYIQAKRYTSIPINREAIDSFSGTLSRKSARSGVFVTTSAFTSGAEETAEAHAARIVLIDGEKLARLMICYDIGCREEEVLRLKKIDEDFFEETE